MPNGLADYYPRRLETLPATSTKINREQKACVECWKLTELVCTATIKEPTPCAHGLRK